MRHSNFRLRLLAIALALTIALAIAGTGQAQTDDYPNTPATAHTLDIAASAATVAGIIENVGDVDLFTFDLDQPSLVRVELTPDGAATTTLEAFYLGADPLDGMVSAAPGSGTVVLERHLEPGSYYLGVDAVTAATSYDLTVSRVTDLASRAQTLDLTTPVSVPGITPADGEYAVFGFTPLTAGLFSSTIAADRDPTGLLISDASQLVAANDDGISPPNSLVQGLATAAQHWLLFKDKLINSSAYLMDYALTAPTPLAMNNTESGTLTGRGDSQLFRFTLSTQATLRLDTTGETDTVIRLYDSLGVLLAMDDDAGLGFNASLTRTLSPGDYYFSISAAEGEPGGYNVNASATQLAEIPASGSTQVSVPAGNVGTSLLVVTRPGGFQLTSSTQGMDLAATLYDQFGNVVATSTPTAGGGFAINADLAAGEYYLVVQSLNQSSGTITLAVSSGAAIAPILELLLL